MSGYHQRGPVAGVVGLVVRFTANCPSAIHVESRLILNNGSHRAQSWLSRESLDPIQKYLEPPKKPNANSPASCLRCTTVTTLVVTDSSLVTVR